jgi:glycosyltransferase involved in cell wall biosynthesis
VKVLAVAPQPFFTPRGTPFSVYYRSLVAGRLGASVDLLTYGEGDDVSLPGVRTIRIPAMRFLGPVRIGPSLGKLVRDIVMALWTTAILIRRRYDVVHAHEEAIFWCQFLRPFFNFKLVYDMHSSLPQQLKNFEYTESRLIGGVFRWLERHALRHSDAVVTICTALAEYAEAEMADSERHILIENSLFDEIRLVAKEGDGHPDSAVGGSAPALPAGRPLVLYAGTFEPYQGLELLLSSFAIAVKEVPDAFLCLVGGTEAQIRQYRDVATERGLGEEVSLSGRVPPHVAKALLARASIVTSPRLTGTNTPLKIYEALASGVPLVATDIASHTQVLDGEVCFLAQPEPDSFAQALVSALTDQESRDRRVVAAQRLYEGEYSPAAYEAKMVRLFQILEPSGPEQTVHPSAGASVSGTTS